MKTSEGTNYYESFKRKRDFSPKSNHKKKKESYDNEDGHYLFNIGEIIYNRCFQ